MNVLEYNVVVCFRRRRMFYIFNKQKIYSYLVATTTIVILLAVSIFLYRDKEESVETWSSSDKTNIAENNIANKMNIMAITKNDIASNTLAR